MTNSANGIQKEIEEKGQKLVTVSQASINLEQLSQMMTQKWSFSQGLHKLLSS